MNRTRKLRTRKAVVAAATLTSVLAGGAAGMLAFGGSANAAGSDTTITAPAAGSSSSSSSDSSSSAAADAGRPVRAEETPLTGDDLTKATEAALAAAPGATVDRAETDGDGGAAYEVHVTQADGTRATVKLNSDFTVAGIETGGPGGGRGGKGGGQGGPHEANGVTETPLTGDDLTKATAAAEAAAPGSTVVRAETDADGDSFEVHITQADGTQATVKLNDDFSLKTVETGGPAGGMGGHGGRGGHGPRGGQAPADAPAAPTDDSTATTTA